MYSKRCTFKLITAQVHVFVSVNGENEEILLEDILSASAGSHLWPFWCLKDTLSGVSNASSMCSALKTTNDPLDLLPIHSPVFVCGSLLLPGPLSRVRSCLLCCPRDA